MNPLDIQYVIELHASLWCEELRKYKTTDFLKGGVIAEDVASTDIPEPIKTKLGKHLYNAYPHMELIYKQKPLSGYSYLVDSDNGLRVVHTEPPRGSA